MIFVRGRPMDHDGWAQKGNAGWSFADVLPCFRRLERFEDGGSGLRGGAGPLDVVRVGEQHALSQAFVAAAREAGFRANPDHNGADQEGFGFYQVNQRRGRRWSAASAYLRLVRGRPNFAIRTEAHATSMLIDGRRVCGVAYRRGDARRG